MPSHRHTRTHACKHMHTHTHTYIHTLHVRRCRIASVRANIHSHIHSCCPFIQTIRCDVGRDLPRIVLVIMFIRFCACVMTNMIALKTSLAVVCAPRLITLGLMKWEIKVHLATRSYLLIHVVQKLMSNALPSSALANLKAFQP